MTQDWYAPGEIRFNRWTALWLIQNLGTLLSGHWPPNASNYVDIQGQRTKGRASFTTPIEYAAEIETRLEQCGWDGLILEAIECWGKSEESMAKYLSIPVWSVRKRLKNALAYVASGPDRRWHDTKKRKGKSYRDFLKKDKKQKELV